MKCITEDALRCELRANDPECYVVPEGKILTPAAREYLQSRKIKIVKAGQQPQPRIVATEVPPMPEVTIPAPAPVRAPPPAPAPIKPKFVDYESGAFYMEKPEHMTHLVGNVLVVKNHPRILFRGKLDSLQSAVVLAQVDIHERGGSKALIDDLGDILNILRETAAHLKENGVSSAGVLATTGTVQAGLFQRALAEQGIRCLTPDEEHQAMVMHVIYSNVKAGLPVEQELLRQAASSLRRQGAQCLILGCTELSLAKEGCGLGAGCLDALDVLARAAVLACGKPLKPQYRRLISE